jgi:hypothetical protein
VLGLVSNPEMKRSEMAWIAWDATSETCSKKIISLEFFANFLFQDKKLGGLGRNPKKSKSTRFQDNCAAINEAKKQ